MTDAFSRYQASGLGYSKDEQKDPLSPLGAELSEPSTFLKELEALINKHSLENASGTPDFILATFLDNVLKSFDTAVQQRANWRGERINSTFDVKYDEKLKITAYDEHGRGNEIGEAEVSIWPGETATHGRLVGLKAIFESPSNPE